MEAKSVLTIIVVLVWYYDGGGDKHKHITYIHTHFVIIITAHFCDYCHHQNTSGASMVVVVVVEKEAKEEGRG